MGEKQSDPTHSPSFGLGLQQRCKELGIGCHLIHLGSPDTKHNTATEYLIQTLTKGN